MLLLTAIAALLISHPKTRQLYYAEPNLPPWGSMVNSGSGYLRSEPWMSVFPGLSIAITMVCFNILGDALRDRIDPRFRP